jgi:pyruvate formate lyase activating enzyme
LFALNFCAWRKPKRIKVVKGNPVMPEGVVFKFKKYALHDGPGIRTTVFLKGCPLKCWWCHNPEGISPAPQTMAGRHIQRVGRRMSVEAVMLEILKDTVFYEESGGGVSFSGGEPLMQPVFLEALLEACRRQGLHTAIDTSGYAPCGTFLRLAKKADLVLFDIKLIDSRKHRTYTGVDNALILENLRVLCLEHAHVRVRLPLVPGVTDDDENIRAVLQLLGNCKGLKGVDLLPFHRIGEEKYKQLAMQPKMVDTAPLSTEAVKAIAARYRQCGLPVAIVG